jgi:hypothetical protein
MVEYFILELEAFILDIEARMVGRKEKSPEGGALKHGCR